MSVGIGELRLAAALAHSASNGDIEIRGAGRRWLVSYRRPHATIDPCGFRRLVLATMKGRRVGLLPAEHLSFVGGLREIGGGVLQRCGEHGMELRFATFVSASLVETLLAGDRHGADAAFAGSVDRDDELGVTVVMLSAAHPMFDHRLDALALRLMGSCLVEELIDTADRAAAP